tara:strand:+ start:655 stop:1848 length:1194 start_codon:yes stop_codon:yes gene_type:complete
MISLKNKKILICVTGSIAAFKTCDIIRLLKKEGAKVQVMMSNSSKKFVGPATFAALTGEEVISDLFPKTPKAGLEHIEMAFDLDLIVVLPATANIICKVANGIADDAISTTLSVCEQPLIFVPAMNNRMWSNEATQEAVEKLKLRNKIIMEPEEGPLASLHKGKGRLPKIRAIINEIRQTFTQTLPLKNKKVLITAGPTRESIDPVRFISNRSSGKMGYALANQAYIMGADVMLISGPVAIEKPSGIKFIQIESALEMYQSVLKNCKKADYIFMAAAVSDYSIKNINQFKIKRSKENLNINLIPAPDILKSISNQTKSKIIAFALETHNGKQEALRKLKEKNADFIVLNYANEDGAGFESDTNRVIIFSKKNKFIELKKNRKDRIANKIIDFILKEN